MEKNIGLNGFSVFSYGISILLVYPFLKLVLHFYNFSVYYLFFISIPSVLVVNNTLLHINEKYNFIVQILKSKFFLYYLLFFLKMENIARNKNNAFLFGVVFSISLIVFYIGLKYEISFKLIWWYIFYYSLLIYIKVRNSLINNEILQVKNNDYLQWKDFLNYYEIKICKKLNTFFSLLSFLHINKNHEFKNITPIFILNDKTHFFYHFLENIKKLRFYVIKFVIGFFSTMVSYFSYSNFVYSIDGFRGTRSRVLHKIESLRNIIQHEIQRSQSVSDIDQENYSITVQNAVKQFRLNRIEKLNDKVFFLEKLSEKIQNLSLIYFLSEKNTSFMKEIYEMLKRFDVSGMRENIILQDFLKKNNFLDYISPENEM